MGLTSVCTCIQHIVQYCIVVYVEAVSNVPKAIWTTGVAKVKDSINQVQKT